MHDSATLYTGALMLALAVCAGCQGGPAPGAPAEAGPIASQSAALKSVSVRPLAPAEDLPLAYWPFAPSTSPGTPGLTRVVVDASISPGGCAPLVWQRHPVPQSEATGRFCVGLLEGLAEPLLVVGRPGGSVDVIVPFVIEAKGDGEERAFARHLPVLALPDVTEAINRWADQPGGGR